MTPRILCVMLASGRQDMVDRAVRSFYSQTYLDKRLLVFDTGDEPLRMPPHGREISYVRASPPTRKLSIGALRNAANEQAGSHGAQIIAHWDSDDWSHPERLADQLALLSATVVDAVGYREIPFWDTSIEGLKRDYPAGPVVWSVPPEGWKGGATWLYSCPNPMYCTGTSLFYWLRAWARKGFDDRQEAEDLLWLNKVKSRGFSAIKREIPEKDEFTREWATRLVEGEPRMIAAIHGSNTTSKITRGVPEWMRYPKLDDFCRGAMQL